ncbi:unnamed protein product [Bemisia tabaci]|uniref:Myb/SANT-like DNA-binding domain-containing protein n=1 Tax=Bemisia tabaci TaxID=7038 RepID=A0A9P0AKI1_BEMTA|nr:unnamed protein product [Bemisia tabaci]
MEPYRMEVFMQDGSFLQAALALENFVACKSDIGRAYQFANELLMSEVNMGTLPPEYAIDRIELYDHGVPWSFNDDEDNDFDAELMHDDLEPNPQVEEHEEKGSYWTRQINVMYESELVSNPTELLIHIYGCAEIQRKINGKAKKMRYIWMDVAALMAERGFPVPAKEGKTVGKQCDDKFRYLKNKYMKYLSPQTGEGKMKKPIYFDLLDRYLGGSQITAPTCLHDSLASTSQVPLSVNTPVSTEIPPTRASPLASASQVPPNINSPMSVGTPPTLASFSSGGSVSSEMSATLSGSTSQSSNSTTTPLSSNRSRFKTVKKVLKPKAATTGDLLQHYKKTTEASQAHGRKVLKTVVKMHKRDHMQMDRFLNMYASANNLKYDTNHNSLPDKENDFEMISDDSDSDSF